LLTAIVIVVTPMLFPGPRRQPPVTDSALVAGDSVAPASTVAPPTRTIAPSPAVAAQAPAATPAVAAPVRAETSVVRTNRAIYHIASPGGTPVAVSLPEYRSLRPGASKEAPLDLLADGDRLLRLAFVRGADTVSLDQVPFSASPVRREGNDVAQTFTGTAAGTPVSLTYRFHPDSFIVRLDGSVTTPAGVTPPTALLIYLPSRIRAEEANIAEDVRSLAMAYKQGNDEVEGVPFRDLDTLQWRVDTGAIHWVAEKNKYFVVAIIAAGRDAAFRALAMRGGPVTGREPTTVHSTAVLPLSEGQFALRLYAGPQSWEHLRKAAPDFENVNPYGGWLHGVVQPFATIVMRMLLWMRHTTNLGYGWVLVIFGVLVRLVLWPLNQNAMRSSLKLQRIQPQLQEVQKKYRDNPERQREAMMKLYQEHGMSPFTPVLGCLPMLLPMPILFALYFVFQNTIELRGVPFLWLPDLALKDPYYITPLFMGISMFVLSWIGMRGMPPSPQGKMMSYVMPVMFTALFWNFASGLNLYYAVQNVAALPQQWLLARERQTTGTAAPPKREKS
jgi:YidC/Oxa1 family membrane protein insertase